ncbi:alpha/beta fold hydrolase [Amycolatopsis sp. GM8]|uniref:alpha/beta fold hydrolase n=1 Tax=Amycolatopsis sp. GM8 TaxID=2896530 RepID=UPI001F2928F2|nr:alpha/beta hydrolase [Amycolatopsis sp. GM8]
MAARPATIPEVTHEYSTLNGARLHYVRAGESGSPVLLVHGFPETWWAFHKLIPLLAARHRVFAVDLRGFGESSNDEGHYDSATSAEDLRCLIDALGLGPVHLTGQDLSGPVTDRLAAKGREYVRSYAPIETGITGFGLEKFMDVTKGGAWHFGFFAAPGIADMVLPGHEREFLTQYAYEGFTEIKGAIGEPDIDEFIRTYSRPDGFRGTTGLYASMLREADEMRALAERPLETPILAVGTLGNRGHGDLTVKTMKQVARDVRSVMIPESGHFVAMEVPDRLAGELLPFFADADQKFDAR